MPPHHTSYTQQIIQQLQKIYTVEIILALQPDKWQSATQLYNKINAPLQTKIKRLNELVHIGIAHERRQPPQTFARRRDIKLNPTYTKLQNILQDTQQKLLKEISNLKE